MTRPRPSVTALPSGDHIASEGHDRTLTTPREPLMADPLELRDELAKAIPVYWAHAGARCNCDDSDDDNPVTPDDGTDRYVSAWCRDNYRAALRKRDRVIDALLPIITRETERARAEVGSLIRAHRDAEAAYWAMADDADDETARRLAADVTSTYEALLASVERES